VYGPIPRPSMRRPESKTEEGKNKPGRGRPWTTRSSRGRRAPEFFRSSGWLGVQRTLDDSHQPSAGDRLGQEENLMRAARGCKRPAPLLGGKDLGDERRSARRLSEARLLSPPQRSLLSSDASSSAGVAAGRWSYNRPRHTSRAAASRFCLTNLFAVCDRNQASPKVDV
jgi:hypothetical protein